jgi:DNA-directed RNA polymerase subunit E'
MYKLVVLEDIVRVPPKRFGEPLERVIEEILKVGYEYKGDIEGGYEGRLDKDLGVILAITGIREIKEGHLIPGDGAAYHKTIYQALTFKPELHEILDGEIVEIVEFGAFIRFGPLDGLIHVSQITDDYIIHDEKREALVGKESNKVLEIGDKVRARVVAVSLNPERSKESKINLTMRQPGLGKFEWLEEEKKKAKGEPKKAEKKEKEKKKEEVKKPRKVEKRKKEVLK